MFIKTYKTTIKRILRSPLFWIVLAVVAVLVFMAANREMYGGVAGTLGDKDPGYVLGYHKYHEMMANLLRNMMLYMIPCLCVVTVMTVIGGDYADNFYEIERAGGVRSASYFFGRLTAILTVLFTLTLIFSFFSVNYYFFTRGGVSNFNKTPTNYIADWHLTSLKDYILDSTKVIFRLVVLCQLPVIIEFVALTYAVGAFLESGILAGIGGNVAVVIAYVAANRYQWDFYSTVYKYFLPARIGSLLYVSRYDTVFNTPEFIAKHGSMYVNDTFESCATWIVVTLGISAVLILYSFISTWRRKI